MRPEDFIKRTRHLANTIRELDQKSVVVGLPVESGSSKVYSSGKTVIQVGADHEFGRGVPQRSFLRMPFNVKRDEIVQSIDNQWFNVIDGMEADQALGLLGAKATNISKGAFTSQGYGQWQDISEFTKRDKGSSQILIDTGTLRNSITWAVRDE